MKIYDASAFFERLKQKELDLDSFILDLTYYEIGNVVLKHSKQLNKITQDEAKSLLQILTNWKNILYLRPEEILLVYQLAADSGLTFYDAAYVYFSKREGAILETADKYLYSKCRNVCKSLFLELSP